jgi:hypothetical protein
MQDDSLIPVDGQFRVKASSLQDIPRIEALLAKVIERRHGGRVFFLRKILDRALEDWLLRKAPKAEVDKILRVAINGRQYWFKGEQRIIVEWTRLFWPLGDDICDVEIAVDSAKRDR